MKSGSSIRRNSHFSSFGSYLAEPTRRQNIVRGGRAHSVLRLRYWLVALVLGLASPAMASTASDDWPGTDARNPIKSDITKVPKPHPSDFPGLGLGAPDTFQVLQPSTNPGPEPTVLLPEASPLQDEDLVTDAADLMLETFEVSRASQSANPALPTDASGPEIAFGFSDPAPLEGVLLTDPTDLSLVNRDAINTSAGDALAQTDLMAQAAASADEIPWRFSFEPFLYLPFGANGDITVRGINAPINAGIGDIFSAIVNDLNFAAFGRGEAWKGPWGIFFSGAYMNLGTGRTANIPVPPVLQQVGLPPQVTLDAAVGTSFIQFDLGGAYRFGDGNLPTALRTADTEFDLGPFIFDALAGLRLYNFNNNLVLTSDLGNRFEFGQSQTIVEPLIGGRARWNLSHNLAALAGASMSGFSIGDLTFSVAGYAGIDWLFSGNTSLLASYGFTYLDYSSGSSGINLFTHGPNIGVKFRF